MPEETIITTPPAAGESTTQPEVIIQTKSLVESLAEFLPELQEDAEAAAKAREENLTPEATPGEVDPTKAEAKPDAKPEAKDKMQERIDELTRKNSDATTRAEQAEAELKRLRDGGGEKKPETSNTPRPGILDAVQTAGDVEARVELAHRTLGYAKAYFRDSEPVFVEDAKAEGGKRELTKEEIRAYESDAEEIIRSAPKRLEFLNNRAARDAASRELFPEFFEDGTDEATALGGMSQITAFDGFEDATNARIALIIGFKELARRRAEKTEKEPGAPAQERKSPEAKPPAEQKKQPIAPVVPGANAAPHVDAEDLALKKAEEEWEESDGGTEALQRFLEAKAKAGRK